MRIGTAGRAWCRTIGGIGLLASLASVPTHAEAQQPADAVVVVHLAMTGGAPGTTAAATVELTSSADLPSRRSAPLDDRRDVTFSHLASGEYQVVVTRSGASTTLTIEAAPGEIVHVDATFPGSGQDGPRLEVRDRWQRWQGVSFFGPALRDLPASSTLWGLLDVAEPFLILDRIDDGGLLAVRTGLAGSRGASWTTMSVHVDDVDLGPPNRTGGLPLVPNLLPFQTATVVTGMMAPDESGPGAAIALSPRQPGPIATGDAAEAFTAGRMVSVNDRDGPPSIARVDSLSDLSTDYGGPLGARAGLFASGASLRSTEEEHGLPLALPADADSGTANVTLAKTRSDQMRLDGAVDRTTVAFDGRDQFANRDVDEHDTFGRLAAAWDHIGTGGTSRSIALGYSRSAWTPDVTSSASGGVVDRVFDGPVPPPPASTATGRLTARVEIQPRDLRLGGTDHAIQLGLTFEHASSTSTVTALPTVGELVDGLPARVWIPQPTQGPSERHDTNAALSLTDDIRLAPHLTLSAGVRAELTRASAVGAPAGIAWATLAPRLSLHWAPAPITLYAGYSRYHPAVSMDWLAFGDPGESWSNVYLWNDLNGNQRVDPGEVGALVARAGWGQSIGSIDPSLKAPVTDELTLGAERRVGTHLRLDAAATFRHESNLLASVDTGAPASDYTVTEILDQGVDYLNAADDRPLAIFNRMPASFGQDRFLLTNAPDGTSRYEGFEVSSTLTADRLFLLVGAMAYLTRESGGDPGFGPLENDQGVLGARLEDPNAEPYEPGASFFDRSYVLKWSVGYEAAHDLHLGVSARYQDGEPFSRLVVAPDLNQGPEIVEAYRIGRTRFTFTLTLDAHVEKGFRFGRRRAALAIDVFNLTNTALEVEENPVTGPNFRETTAVQPPRTVRVTFKVMF